MKHKCKCQVCRNDYAVAWSGTKKVCKRCFYRLKRGRRIGRWWE